MITRRRFLAISAAASLVRPAHAQTVRWHGYAMGAEVSLTLEAITKADAEPVLERIRAELGNCEALFSLYDPTSALSHLNRDGALYNPDPTFHRLLDHCSRMHRATGGRFDPTVQPLWRALASSGDIETAQAAVGWHRVMITPEKISLGQHQELTLNGIAQGFATDQVSKLLRQAGFTQVLVNIGEFQGSGRDWTLGISDPVHGLVATRTLKDRALATSSPGAMQLTSAQTHILDPLLASAPIWSTVSVEAQDATTADALSTAFCHAPVEEMKAILSTIPGTPVATCVAQNGTVLRITG